jgi:hypothetical protein
MQWAKPAEKQEQVTTDRNNFWDQPLEPDPVVEAYKKDVDRTLIRENLKLTPEQRLRRLMEFQRFAEELRRAGRRNVL